MRPIDKGTAPSTFARYQEAQPDLVARLGDYCSYCERQIETNLAVEHVQPKSRAAPLATSWSNFLLGCVNCNSCKGRRAVRLGDYFWPDTDNTLRAFTYSRGGLIEPSSGLGPALSARARATIALTGLDRVPGTPGRAPSTSDWRWLRRQQVWQLAEADRDRLRSNDTVEVRELIVENALARGMFSIWWSVFAGDVDMRRRLRSAFVGTHTGCFDANEDLVARPGGQL